MEGSLCQSGSILGKKRKGKLSLMAKQTADVLTNEKANGRVYTPAYIVKNILDLCEYSGGNILEKHIIDNSCGDGAFLGEVVRRYCEAAFSAQRTSEQLKAELEQFIHGIEIDGGECEKCITRVSEIAEQFSICDVQWDICRGDTLTIDRYNGQMDYVVGNPPYVRVHNLLDSYSAVKEFSFAQSGMTDLFIVFYEIGLKMLNENGVLGYIAPSSLFNSLAGTSMREYLVNGRNIKAVVDLKHFQPFAATTYTAIMILTRQPQGEITYYEYDKDSQAPAMVSVLNYDEFYINGIFAFGNRSALEKWKKIISYSGKQFCEVKNGFATLFDKFFIGDWSFDAHTIPVVKGSTGKWTKCLFPYDKCGKLLPFEVLAEDERIAAHYAANTEKLKARSLGPSEVWYGFGRSQGINDVYRKKYAINTLLRNTEDIKLSVCKPGTGVYSGLYILTELSLEEIKDILFTDDFIRYISILGKYKSGGYYTFSSKDLQRYINYMAAKKGKEPMHMIYVPPRPANAREVALMSNTDFLSVLKRSFSCYLRTGGRSNEKLKILHGAIAADLEKRLRAANQTRNIFSVASLGYRDGRELSVKGLYMDKKVDLTICKNGWSIAGIGVKYVMSNYSQNSINYFENMLGETANLRSNNVPYFQIFVVPDHLPYFEKDGSIQKWEEISPHNIQKYIVLSKARADIHKYVPDKILVCVVDISGYPNINCENRKEYIKFYQENDFTLTLSQKVFNFSEGVVYNDYEDFMEKMVQSILNL